MKLIEVTLGLVIESGRGVDKPFDRLRQIRRIERAFQSQRRGVGDMLDPARSALALDM